MSYADGSGGARNRALTGGAVALIQTGIAVALVSGFAVTFTPPDKPRNLASEFFPTAPATPDKAEQAKSPEKQPITFTVTVAKPLAPPVADRPSLKPVEPLPFMGGMGSVEPTVAPTLPTIELPARFAAKGAIPRGNVARWVTTEDYPSNDVRLNHTGAVRFRLAIDASGKVAGCTVLQSSNYESLDAATCRLVSRRARFDPARDTTGEAATGSYEGTIRWVIPRD